MISAQFITVFYTIFHMILFTPFSYVNALAGFYHFLQTLLLVTFQPLNLTECCLQIKPNTSGTVAPSCTESVTWTVFRDAVNISQYQVHY